ncbi:MAG: NAD(P)H-binding protein [Pseudomonadota bacterium]
MTRAFIAGATGYTGRELVRALAEKNVEAIAHVRPDSSRLGEWKGRFDGLGARMDTTAWVKEAMDAALAGLRPDLVFCLLGTTKARGRGSAGRGIAENYETVDFGLTAMVIDASVKLKKKPLLIYLSAMGVKEKSRNPYFSARWKAEKKLRESGLPYIIVRPVFVSGPDRDERRIMERVGATAWDGALAVAGAMGFSGLRDRYKSINASGLARGMVRLAFDPSAVNTVVERENL